MFGVLPLILVSCVQKELDSRLETTRTEIVSDAGELRTSLNSGEGRELDWKTAVELLGERNLGLRRSRVQLEDAKERRDEQWKTFLPRPSAFANLQTSLAELGNLSTDSISVALIAPLSIPNPVSERARAFEHALTYLSTRDSHELNYRRQVSGLYQLFSRYQRNREELDRLIEERTSAPPSVSGALASLQDEATREETLRSLEASLARQLDLPGTHPVPRPGTLPKIDYAGKVEGFIPGKNYAKLAVRLSAYQIEAALLQEKGIKLRQFPFLTVNASTPALYDSRREDPTGGFQSERIFLFGGLTQSFDLTNTPFDQIESAEENTEFVRANLRQRLDQESRQWLQLKQNYRDLALKRRLAKERLEIIVQRSRGGAVLAELEAFRQARLDLESIESAEEQLNLEVWIWDDSRW